MENKEILVEDILQKAEQLSGKGEYEEALMLLDKLDIEGERGGLICFVRGNIYAHKAQWESAHKWYGESLRRSFVDEKLFMNYGNLKLQLGQPAEAVDMFYQAFELAPTNIMPLNKIVQIRLENQNYQGAVKTIQQMIHHFPEMFDGYHHHVDMLLGTGKNQEALEFLEKYEKQFSANLLFIYDKAKALDGVGREQEALDYLQGEEDKFVGMPMHVMFKKLYSKLLFGFKEYGKALPVLVELFDRYRDREAGIRLIVMSIETKEFALACEIADRLMMLSGKGRNCFMAAYYKALAQEAMENKEAARETYQSLLKEMYELEEELPMELMSIRLHAEYSLGKDKEMQTTLEMFERFLEKHVGNDEQQLQEGKKILNQLESALQKRANSFC